MKTHCIGLVIACCLGSVGACAETNVASPPDPAGASVDESFSLRVESTGSPAGDAVATLRLDPVTIAEGPTPMAVLARVSFAPHAMRFLEARKVGAPFVWSEEHEASVLVLAVDEEGFASPDIMELRFLSASPEPNLELEIQQVALLERDGARALEASTALPSRNASTSGASCMGIMEDVNSDGVVDILDLVHIVNALGAPTTATDVNSDGNVDILDLVSSVNAMNGVGSNPKCILEYATGHGSLTITQPAVKPLSGRGSLPFAMGTSLLISSRPADKSWEFVRYEVNGIDILSDPVQVIMDGRKLVVPRFARCPEFVDDLLFAAHPADGTITYGFDGVECELDTATDPAYHPFGFVGPYSSPLFVVRGRNMTPSLSAFTGDDAFIRRANPGTWPGADAVALGLSGESGKSWVLVENSSATVPGNYEAFHTMCGGTVKWDGTPAQGVLSSGTACVNASANEAWMNLVVVLPGSFPVDVLSKDLEVSVSFSSIGLSHQLEFYKYPFTTPLESDAIGRLSQATQISFHVELGSAPEGMYVVRFISEDAQISTGQTSVSYAVTVSAS